MKRDEFLTLRHWPALLSVNEVAWLLGIEPFYVPVLTAAKLLKPVGKPVQNGRKFFAREQLLASSKDEIWLNKIAVVMVSFNRNRNCAADGLPDSNS